MSSNTNNVKQMDGAYMKQVDEMNVSARVDPAKKSVFGFLSAGAFHSCGQFIRIDRIVQITCFF